MNISDDIDSQVTVDLPPWVPESWHSVREAPQERIIARILESLESGHSERFLDIIQSANTAVFTCARSLKVRNRPSSWVLHLLKGDEIVISWRAGKPVTTVLPGVPMQYLRMVKSLGLLSFMSWRTDVLDIDDMDPARWGIPLGCAIPFFPHGNGDFDVFHVSDQTVLTYNHEYDPEEEGILTVVAASFQQWIELRLDEYWHNRFPKPAHRGRLGDLHKGVNGM